MTLQEQIRAMLNAERTHFDEVSRQFEQARLRHYNRLSGYQRLLDQLDDAEFVEATKEVA